MAKVSAETTKKISENVALAQELISKLNLNAEDFDLGVGLDDLQAIVDDLHSRVIVPDDKEAAKEEADSEVDPEAEVDEVAEAPKAKTFAEMHKESCANYKKAYHNPQSQKK